MTNWVITPEVVTLSRLFSAINQRLPSGPAMIWRGGWSLRRDSPGTSLFLGIAYSVRTPEVVIFATLPGPPPAQQNPAIVIQRFPSGPAAMLMGLNAAGTLNSVMMPDVVTTATLPGFPSRNQTLPVGPAVIAPGSLSGVGIV